MHYAKLGPLEKLHAVVQAHRIYMGAIGFVEDARFFHGVNPAALRVLHDLHHNQPGPWTVGPVANCARMSHSNASHVLSDLRKQALVECAVDPVDRRHRLYCVTPAGERIASTWDRYLAGAIMGVVSRWPLDKQHAVGTLMVDLSRALSYQDW